MINILKKWYLLGNLENQKKVANKDVFSTSLDFSFDLGEYCESIHKRQGKLTNSIKKSKKQLDGLVFENDLVLDSFDTETYVEEKFHEISYWEYNENSAILSKEEKLFHSLLDKDFLSRFLTEYTSEKKEKSFPTREELAHMFFLHYNVNELIDCVKESIVTRLKRNYLKAIVSQIWIKFRDSFCLIIPLDLIEYEYIDLKCTIKDMINNLNETLKSNYIKLLNHIYNERKIFRPIVVG
ncbi:hypothetical protein [Carboxylicivirga marina]|uniref:hypothetical protein n=1 Tax=Carboxylicivirga marina TaxID=2800988 RepID=UPI002591EDB8|nr:hypothetical protein [uncultured Carboxylicivirga sp.]